MLDRHLRPLLDTVLAKPVTWLARTGISANQLTLVGFAFGILTALCVYSDAFVLALFLFLLSRLCDALDGLLARKKGPTDFGGFLDIVLDFMVYAAIPLAFALRVSEEPKEAIAAALLLFSFIGTGTSFLAFAILAEKKHTRRKQQGQPQKSFVYVGGIMEGTETTIGLAACLAFPWAFFWIALVLSALCWLTTAGRIFAAWQSFAR